MFLTAAQYILIGVALSECKSYTQPFQSKGKDNDYDAQYVTFKSLETRKPNGERLLQFRAFDQDYNLLLTPHRSSIFAPAYKYMEMKRLADGRTAIVEREPLIFNETNEQLYDIAETGGSIYITDKSDVVVNGIISDQLVVKPVPNEGLQSSGGSHIVYKMKANNVSERKYDYIKLDNLEVPTEIETQTAPSEVTVKVLVIMDNVNTLALNSNQREIETYAAIFWNSIQRRYAPATNPKIKLAIAGVIVIPNAADQPFITSNLNTTNPNLVEGSGLIESLKIWLKPIHKNIKIDAAILHTGLDGYNKQSGSRSEAGMAITGSACTSQCVGYGEDLVPFFAGVIVIAHELAHIFNSRHDGTGTSSNCSPEAHNTMTPEIGPNMPEQWTFSKCSLNAITSFLRSSAGNCTWTAPPADGVHISDILPGHWEKARSPDEFCAKRYGPDWVYKPTSARYICEALYCKNTNYFEVIGSVPEGTSCDYNKMCSNGYCTESSIPSADQQCTAKFGSGARALDVFDATACNNLRCSRNGQTQQAGPAKDGTSCGLAGLCRNKQCVGQTSVSLAEICKTRISVPGFIPEQTDEEKQSCKFRCVHPEYMPLVKYVPDLLPCGERSVCRQQRCIPI